MVGIGGSGGIRTHGTLSCSMVFKTVALNQTLPRFLVLIYLDKSRIGIPQNCYGYLVHRLGICHISRD